MNLTRYLKEPKRMIMNDSSEDIVPCFRQLFPVPVLGLLFPFVPLAGCQLTCTPILRQVHG